jgi:hypothetical protein
VKRHTPLLAVLSHCIWLSDSVTVLIYYSKGFCDPAPHKPAELYFKLLALLHSPRLNHSSWPFFVLLARRLLLGTAQPSLFTGNRDTPVGGTPGSGGSTCRAWGDDLSIVYPTWPRRTSSTNKKPPPPWIPKERFFSPRC